MHRVLHLNKNGRFKAPLHFVANALILQFFCSYEEGILKNVHNLETEAQFARGQFSYTGNNGILTGLTYTIEENGFVAKGAQLPTTTPIPVTTRSSTVPGLTPSDRKQHQPCDLTKSRNTRASDKGHKELSSCHFKVEI